MENRRSIICFAFLFITCSSAEFLIQQVTEGRVSETEHNNLTRVMREERPSSKIVTIGNFSVIKKRSEAYESSVFEASGYKWSLILYVKGNKNDEGTNHISLYVRILETESLPNGWELNVDLKLFVHNPQQGKYLTVTDGVVKRYSEAKKAWGFGQLIPLSTFYNMEEGYVVEDTCSFGAEIFIVKPVQQQEKVTFVSNPPDNVFTWNIPRFSTLQDKFYYSGHFLVGDRYWRLGFNPKGPRALPIYLFAQGFKPNAVATTTFVAVRLRLRDQLGSNHKKRSAARWLPIRPGYGVGVTDIILLKNLRGGYLVNDTIVFEAEVVMVSVTNIVPT